MKTKNNTLFRGMSFLAIAAVLVSQVALFSSSASAAQIVDRKLVLEAGASDGGSKPGGVVNHFYEFTLPGGSDVGSIKFEYCTTAANSAASPTCIAPTGLNISTATLSAQTGATGFTNLTHVPGSENNVLYISRVSASSVSPNQLATYRLSGATNPTNEETFFVRINTYITLDASGAPTDSGTVNASTAEPIDLTGTMPESLVFCTGETVPVNVNSVPDCAAATPGDIEFNQLFSPTDTAVATSQMAASTNAGAGYVITVNGPTLTSGSNTITPLNALDTSKKGVSQFGLNLKENTTASASTFTIMDDAEVSPLPNATNYRGQAATDYDTADSFKFANGNTVANSFNGGAGGTDAQIFTVSYIVNVPGSQPAGTYTSTLTYICTPTF
jgi:hypothetical protein